MRPTKTSIRTALAVLLLAAPAALADDAVAPAEETSASSVGAAESPSGDPEAADTTTSDFAAAPNDALADDGEGSETPVPAAAAETSMGDPEPASDTTAAADPTDVQPLDPEDEALDPQPVASQDPLAAPPMASEDALDTHPPLGAVGYDSQGRQGRIHIVVRGDTLWDISNAYLGTPWVWPSVWKDNGEIENPHLIHPGDRIWITPGEMRKISAEEAAILLSNLPPEDAEPAAQEDFAAPEPEPEPEPVIAEPMEYGTIRVSNRESAGLITQQQMDASGSVVARERERLMLSQEDELYLGLGEGDVQVGDQLTVFRTHEKVFDPDTNVLLGYHVEFLGWVEVTEISPETSLARIGMSDSPIEEGDRVMPRQPLPQDIALRTSPDVEGKISFFPQKRVVIGFNDFVYLNRGSIDGLEVGSPLDVYRPGFAAHEPVRDEDVMVPDSVIGRLVVVRTEDESAVAWVMRSNTELALGDRFRGAGL